MTVDEILEWLYRRGYRDSCEVAQWKDSIIKAKKDLRKALLEGSPKNKNRRTYTVIEEAMKTTRNKTNKEWREHIRSKVV